MKGREGKRGKWGKRLEVVKRRGKKGGMVVKVGRVRG